MHNDRDCRRCSKQFKGVQSHQQLTCTVQPQIKAQEDTLEPAANLDKYTVQESTAQNGASSTRPGQGLTDRALTAIQRLQIILDTSHAIL
jgi:hypothetical protein